MEVGLEREMIYRNNCGSDNLTRLLSIKKGAYLSSFLIFYFEKIKSLFLNKS